MAQNPGKQHAFEHIEHRRAVGVGVRADPDFGSSLCLVTAGGHPRAEPAELTMFIGWTWGAAVAMRIVDHVASLAAGRAG